MILSRHQRLAGAGYGQHAFGSRIMGWIVRAVVVVAVVAAGAAGLASPRRRRIAPRAIAWSLRGVVAAYAVGCVVAALSRELLQPGQLSELLGADRAWPGCPPCMAATAWPSCWRRLGRRARARLGQQWPDAEHPLGGGRLRAAGGE
jgi:hypothetical protein